MAAKQAKRNKKLKKLRKTGLPTGKSSQRRYEGPGRSTVDLEQHLLSRPFVSKPVPELPTSINQIRVKMKRLPEDLKGIVHDDGRISIPLDAKHRASNWHEVLEHLDRLGASKQQIGSLADDTEHRIIQRLKRSGRIVEASKRDERGKPRTAAPAAGPSFQELSLSPEDEEAEQVVPQIPENITPIELQGKIRLSETEADLGSLSVRELFELARDIRVQLGKRGDTETQRSRSDVVKAFAKAWANGICQFCGNPAQYRDMDGTPRLHVHHISYLGDDGADSIENVVALCPNCHDIIHLRRDRIEADLLRSKVHDRLSHLLKEDE
jgi:hypothetical protein